jgi:hypothetical protein
VAARRELEAKQAAESQRLEEEAKAKKLSEKKQKVRTDSSKKPLSREENIGY